SMVRAGHEGGFLEDVLKRIATFVEHQEDLKAKVIGALAYPVFLAIAGFLFLTILTIFFVPNFEPIFAKLREQGDPPVLTTSPTRSSSRRRTCRPARSSPTRCASAATSRPTSSR